MSKAEHIVTRAQNWHSKWRKLLPLAAANELEQILLGKPTPPDVPPRPEPRAKRRWWQWAD